MTFIEGVRQHRFVTALAVAGTLVVAAVAITVALWNLPDTEAIMQVTPAPLTEPSTTQPPVCDLEFAAIEPTSANVSSHQGTIPVITVQREPNGQVGAPPLTDLGKSLIGWDPIAMPGNGTGTVILDAHTYPDGSALGNDFLNTLQPGAIIALGDGNGRGVCYTVTARDSYPLKEAPVADILRADGPERLVMIVCSGTRLGPGDWSDRTIWTAEPMPQSAYASTR